MSYSVGRSRTYCYLYNLAYRTVIQHDDVECDEDSESYYGKIWF